MAALIALLASAWALTPTEEAQLAELERVRREIADQVHLSAFDLVDEMVWGWMQDPVFDKPTPVVLAGVTVPVGMGTGLQALVENHLSAGLADNPATHVQLSHCPTCTQVVVHSGPEGTVVTRGIDNPEVLADLGGNATGKHALFVDIEAEGSWLVLRARITRLTPDLPIVWSHTLTTSAGTPALLRDPKKLKSAEEAREDYLAALQSRGPVQVPLRFAVRTFAQPFTLGTPPPPFLWVQTGAELATTDARTWTASVLAGYSFIPQAYQGIMAQARVSRLVSGRVRSVSRPDLYAFIGGAVFTVWGPATASFQTAPLTADQIIAGVDGDDPRTTFGGFHVGVDLRVGNRIGVSTFLETLPELVNSENIGRYVQFGFTFQTIGTEVSVWF